MLIGKKDLQIDYWHNFYRTVFANLEEVLIVADVVSDQVEYISPNGERVLGIRQDDQVSASCLLKQIGLLERPDLTILKNRKEQEEERYLMELQSEEDLWCRCCWSFLQGYSDKHEKLIVNISDRSKERASMDRIRQDLQEAQRANAAKSRFLTTLSHDMRVPMNAIMGLTDLAMEYGEEQEKVQEYLYKISRSSAHLLELINDVLDMSRIESGQMILEYRSFSIREMLRNVMAIIQPQSEAKMQTLDTDWAFEHDRVTGDPVRIRQILINILSNGVKYTQRGGNIFFQVKETGIRERNGSTYAVYQIKVYDNGYGMSESFQQMIFEPFAKERRAKSEEIEGTGLGMAITKRLVDAMGGTLALESRLGEGTIFTIGLPLKLQEEAAREQAVLSDKSCSFNGIRVLLVEDNEITADVLSDILELMGLRVIRAENGEKAVRIFEKEGDSFDLILMDVQMPVMDGYEATRRIRGMKGKGRTIPIAALTGNVFSEDIQASREAGMDCHLSKPVKKKELERVLTQLLSR